MNTNDELDTMTDAALSEAFAREVAGWRFQDNSEEFRPSAWISPLGHVFYNEPYYPLFATSADALSPFITQPHIEQFTTYHVNGRWTAIALHRDITDRNFVGTAPTFARAACIALLRANRAEKGQP